MYGTQLKRWSDWVLLFVLIHFLNQTFIMAFHRCRHHRHFNRVIQLFCGYCACSWCCARCVLRNFPGWHEAHQPCHDKRLGTKCIFHYKYIFITNPQCMMLIEKFCFSVFLRVLFTVFVPSLVLLMLLLLLPLGDRMIPMDTHIMHSVQLENTTKHKHLPYINDCIMCSKHVDLPQKDCRVIPFQPTSWYWYIHIFFPFVYMLYIHFWVLRIFHVYSISYPFGRVLSISPTLSITPFSNTQHYSNRKHKCRDGFACMDTDKTKHKHTESTRPPKRNS